MILSKKQRIKRYFQKLLDSDRNPNKRVTPVGLSSKDMLSWLRTLATEQRSFEESCLLDTARKYRMAKVEIQKILETA